jgi:DNA-binding transcriptional regulator YiaG
MAKGKMRKGFRTARSARRSTALCERVRELRRQLGRQDHVAEQLGISVITLSRWENGHVQPPKMVVYALERLIIGAQVRARSSRKAPPHRPKS